MQLRLGSAPRKKLPACIREELQLEKDIQMLFSALASDLARNMEKRRMRWRRWFVVFLHLAEHKGKRVKIRFVPKSPFWNPKPWNPQKIWRVGRKRTW